MDCIINSSMYIRSNGNVVCWDDSGCNKVLQAFDKDVDYANDVYLGGPYNEIRNRLKTNILPHGNICTACHLLNPQMAFNSRLSDQKVLQSLQVESSFACQIACPNCYPGVKRRDAISKTAGGHLNLGLEAYKVILGSLAQGGVDIREIVFEGHGEPLLNPRIWDMIKYTKELYSSAWIRVVTNGNFKFRADMALSGVSHMVFSIDGANKSSYDKYRVDGNFSLCEAFMKEFCEYASCNNIPLRALGLAAPLGSNDQLSLEDVPLDDSASQTKSMSLRIANGGALVGPEDDGDDKESHLFGTADSEAAALALMSYATKLRRLYGEKAQLLVTSHYKLACRAMGLLPSLQVDSRGEIAAMLSGFVRNSIDSALPQTQLLVPVMHLNEIKYGLYEVTGNDPIFVLYAEKLKMPMGKVRMSYSARIIEGDLRDPELFFDMGEGFNAIQCFDLGKGPLADCDKVLFLPNGVRRLRFDPCRSEGKFEISNFQITWFIMFNGRAARQF